MIDRQNPPEQMRRSRLHACLNFRLAALGIRLKIVHLEIDQGVEALRMLSKPSTKSALAVW